MPLCTLSLFIYISPTRPLKYLYRDKGSSATNSGKCEGLRGRFVQVTPVTITHNAAPLSLLAEAQPGLVCICPETKVYLNSCICCHMIASTPSEDRRRSRRKRGGIMVDHETFWLRDLKFAVTWLNTPLLETSGGKASSWITRLFGAVIL